MNGSGYGILFMILLFLGFMVYFLPAYLGRNKKDSTGILLLNIFLGWTAIGWIVALVWAVTSIDKKDVVRNNNSYNSNNGSVDDFASQLRKLNELRREGALTEEEFQEQKAIILERNNRDQYGV